MHECGDCSMCCKLLHVGEINKPAGKWCPHVDVGHGCTIYATRPKSCSAFECMWLQEETMPEDLKPNKSHVVLWVNETGEFLMVSVDPNFPEAYKQGEMANLLKSMLQVPEHKIGIIIGSERFPLLSEFELSNTGLVR
jgi:hypothetical protein